MRRSAINVRSIGGMRSVRGMDMKRDERQLLFCIFCISAC